jgi:Kef-type K+ transport system membrane component KefB
MMHALIMLLLVGALMHAGRTFLHDDAAHAWSGTTLSFGFLLLVAFFAGKALAALRLPRLTGYIVAGVIAGPSVLGLVSREMVRALGPVQGVAICLIALAAGGELNVRRMRPLLRTIRSMIGWVVGGSVLACTLTVMVLRPWLPFLSGLGFVEALVVAAVLGVSLSAMSPAVVMALLGETHSDGRVSRTMLGVVVAADLVVIVLFALVASGSQAVLGGASDAAQAARHVSWELFGSAAAGVAAGILLTAYLRKVRDGRALFVLLVCVVISEIGSRLALDPLIVALSAGLFMENVSEIETTKLIHEIEAASLPIYVVFFAVAGAALRLDVLFAVAVPAGVLVAVRAAAVWLGSRIAARRSGADRAVRNWAFTAYLPQAGLALALPLMFPKVLPGIAEGPAALVLGIVGINQVLMPPLLRLALLRTGEAGRAESVAASDGGDAQPAPAPVEKGSNS